MLFICKGKSGSRKLKTPEGRKFLLALLVVFMIAAACVGRATIVGVIEQYNIPLSAVDDQHVCVAIGDDLRLQPGVHRSACHPLGIFFLGDAKSIKRYR
jgi:hypothetical protein